MELLQIQAKYQPEEDRVLLRVAFGDRQALPQRQEIQTWLTRRLLSQFWPAILQTLSQQIALNKPEAAQFSTDIAQMEHLSCVASMKKSGNFNLPYQDAELSHPLAACRT